MMTIKSLILLTSSATAIATITKKAFYWRAADYYYGLIRSERGLD